MKTNTYDKIKLMEKDLTKNISTKSYNNDISNLVEDVDLFDEFGVVKKLISKYKENRFCIVFLPDFSNTIIKDLNYSIIAKFNIELSINKLSMYGESFLFAMKKIIKGLTVVSAKDKKILWDRVKLFSNLLKNSKELDNQKADIILNDLEFDDPLEYIAKEFKEITQAYEIKEDFLIVINEISSNNFEYAYDLYKLLKIIFKDLNNFNVLFEVKETIFINYFNKFTLSANNELYNFDYILSANNVNQITQSTQYNQEPNKNNGIVNEIEYQDNYDDKSFEDVPSAFPQKSRYYMSNTDRILRNVNINRNLKTSEKVSLMNNEKEEEKMGDLRISDQARNKIRRSR